MADPASQPVPEGDARLALVGVLIGKYAGVIGNATVLSSEIAVTAAAVADSARAAVEVLTTDRASPIADLRLGFPQLRSPNIDSVLVAVQTIDSDCGFGVLRLSAALPLPVALSVPGTGQIPGMGTECDVLYADASQQFFEVSGRVGERLKSGFRLRLKGDAASPAMGAPVFADGRIVGIVVSGPKQDVELDQSSFDSPALATPSVEVLSVDAMARSTVTTAVRNLLRRIEADQKTPRPLHTGMEITQTPVAESARSDEAVSSEPTAAGRSAEVSATLAATPNQKSEPPAISLSDREMFARLSVSARGAVERANGMRIAMGLKEVHMEQLVVGLFEKHDGPTRRLFGKAQIDAPTLLKIIHEVRDQEIPTSYTPVSLEAFPPLSEHANKAIQAAVRRRSEQHTDLLRSRHLLYGALSVDECGLIKALQEHGIRKEDIYTVVTDDLTHQDPGAVNDAPTGTAPSSPQNTPEARTEPRAVSPTPRVDSDLWSEEDRLGYEAYARTIASLITHRETRPPMTIGIKAPWGAGKTTLMKRVQHLLDGDAHLSEQNRSGILQEGPAQVTMRELLKELKVSSPPGKLEEKRNQDREAQRPVAKPSPDGKAPEREESRSDVLGRLKATQSKDGAAYGLEPRITVWFNAWKYQTSEQIWAGMAHCIISQVTARMSVRERELFWVRLHARRINANEVRRKVYEQIVRQLFPLALMALVVCAIVIWVAVSFPVLGPIRYVISGISLLGGLLGVIWKAWDKLGEKAAGTMRELIREPDYEGKMGYLHLVESDIREVLQLATVAPVTTGNQKVNPLVVFVDDLDRCAPNKVAEVVEAINLFLCGDYPNCVFVLGMEPGMVAAALEVANKDVIQKAEEMGLTDHTAPVGWRFMEKIVQLPIMIPPPTKAGQQKYVNWLTAGGTEFRESGGTVEQKEDQGGAQKGGSRPAHYGEEEDKKVKSYLEKIGPAKSASEAARKGVDVVAQAPAEEKWAAQEAGNRIYERTLSENDPVTAQFLERVAQLVSGNPRQIKRYVNVFRFYSTLRHSLRLAGVVPSEDLPSDEMLAKFVALSIRWPHAVDCLRAKEVYGADGKKCTLLALLETRSKKIGGKTADGAWEKLVGKDGFDMGEWAKGRAFREFLAEGESLCAKEGHGLW